MSAEKGQKAGRKPPKGSYEGISGTTGGASSTDSGSAAGSATKSSSRPDRVPPPQQADVGEIARAVSTGFTLLILGGLLQPVVTRFVPFLGLIWLILVAVVAFAYTGFRAGRAGPNPPVFGGASAVGAYVLVLPVLFLVGTFDPVYVASTLAVGVVVGALAGVIGARTNRGD